MGIARLAGPSRTGPGGFSLSIEVRVPKQSGFTLIELMLVLVILGLLAAFAIPNYISSQNRAKESALKTNMHTFQLAAEDFRVMSDSSYAVVAGTVALSLPPGFKNPFNQSVGGGNAWEDREVFSGNPSSTTGVTSYADSSNGHTYNIKGQGRSAPLSLVLTSGN
jgi:prepilin-type N-terminal cleavage/methylation domain-containing protein